MARASANRPTAAVAWAFGVVVAALVLVGGFWICFVAVTGRGLVFDPERDLILLGPYGLSAINILLAPRSRAIRWLAVALLGVGAIMGGLVLVEAILAIKKDGRPPAMFAAMFPGAFGLIGQYHVSGGCFLGLSIAWLVSFGSRRPATDQAEDYAD